MIQGPHAFGRVVNMAFKCPPERLLRDVIRRSNFRLSPSSSVTSAAKTYQTSLCTELAKPISIAMAPSNDLSPGDGQVKVEVYNGGVNYADILICEGKYQRRPELPFTPGSEISGQIVEVGAEVTRLKVGDRIAGITLTGTGGFAQECLASETGVWKIPNAVKYRTASSIVCTYATALLALKRRANIQKGDTVLVTAAAGGVGLAAVDLAANVFGATVIGACGGPEKGRVVLNQGAQHVIDYKTESIKERVNDITDGQGADIIFDAVGGEVFKQCLKCIAFEGRLIVIGFTSGEIPQIPANILLLKNCSAIGVFWGNYSFKLPPQFHKTVEDVIRYLELGKISPHISKSFPLNKVNEAFSFVKGRQSTGKVVIDIRQESVPADKII